MPTIMRRINMISRCEGLYRNDQMKDSDLTACHHSYILAICRHPGISQEALARHICINKSNVTRHLTYLEKHGYIRRQPKPEDKRVILVEPTQKMWDILPSVEQIVADWNAYITNGISEEELFQFCSVLERMADRAKEYTDCRDE